MGALQQAVEVLEGGTFLPHHQHRFPLVNQGRGDVSCGAELVGTGSGSHSQGVPQVGQVNDVLPAGVRVHHQHVGVRVAAIKGFAGVVDRGNKGLLQRVELELGNIADERGMGGCR